MKNEKLEKQASSEIAQSRDRFAQFWLDQEKYTPIWSVQAKTYLGRPAQSWAAWQAAERDTRERCAQIAEGIAGTEPDGVFEAGYDCGARMAAERIRGKE